jgi:hypothetical protein
MIENPDGPSHVENCREQAARCRRLASLTWDREIARRLIELAQEFERRVSQLETEERR